MYKVYCVLLSTLPLQRFSICQYISSCWPMTRLGKLGQDMWLSLSNTFPPIFHSVFILLWYRSVCVPTGWAGGGGGIWGSHFWKVAECRGTESREARRLLPWLLPSARHSSKGVCLLWSVRAGHTVFQWWDTNTQLGYTQYTVTHLWLCLYIRH